MADEDFKPPTEQEKQSALAQASTFIPPTDAEKAAVINYLNKPPMSMTASAAQGLANGGTLGFAPRIGAASGALASSAQQSLSGEPNKQSLKDLYNEYLKYNNQLQANAKSDNPLSYYAGALAGGALSPLNKVGTVGSMGQAAENAPMLAKMAHGAVAGAKIGTVAGLAQSPDLTNASQDINHAVQGAGLGMGIGAIAPPVIGGIQAGAGATAAGLKSVFGPVGQQFKSGIQAGMEGGPNLATESGQQAAMQSRNQFAGNFIDNVQNIIKSNAKNKVQLIQQAAAEGNVASPQDVNAVMQKYLQANPKFNDETSINELKKMQGMILNAIEGAPETQTVRMPLSQPESSDQPGFTGYKKVMSKVINPNKYLDVDAETAEPEDILNPKTEKDAFEQEVEQKRAEQRALAGSDEAPIETHYEPIEGSDNVLAVARQPQYDLGKVQQPGPTFQDIQQTVRPGDRNIQSPDQLYALQQLMNNYSRFSEGRGFSSPQMNQMAGQASQDISGLIKQTVPETQPIDQQLTAANNVMERLGIDTDKLNIPGGTGEKAQADATQKFLNVLNPQTLSDKGQLNEDSIDYIHTQLQKIDPQMADTWKQQAQQQIDQKGLVDQFSKPYQPSGINMFMNAIRRNAGKAAYGTGYMGGQEAARTAPALTSVKNIYQNYTPDAIQQAAQGVMSSTDAATQKLGQVLSKVATSDERSRNAMMFAIMQNPGYRAALEPYLQNPTNTPETDTNARNNSLEKYK